MGRAFSCVPGVRGNTLWFYIRQMLIKFGEWGKWLPRRFGRQKELFNEATQNLSESEDAKVDSLPIKRGNVA
ncbi:MAG: hypothetical protein D6681_19490 [Calditrichaeota bacterium]|nr:MAG: hypothetical protein D6681_19490 [Calditrichota bacterium]